MSRQSITFFTDEPGPKPTNLPSTVNTELISYISQKALDAGFTNVKELAKAFDTKNHDKIRRNLQEFGQTSSLNTSYMKQLEKLLKLDAIEIDAIKKRHHDKLYAESDLFIDNFELLFRHGKEILENETYRNISFFGLFISSAWVSRQRPLTLGELFYHYKHSDWIMPDCCGSVYVISGAGSPLSGSNKYKGYCRKCKKLFSGSRPSFKEILRPFLKNEPVFAYVPTDYTIKELVDDLLKLESMN